jgi:hypothetical protein
MFHCPACAAGFAWKPKYAGHKVRCKCGEVFAAADPQRAAAEPQRHTSPQPHTGPQNHAPRQSQAGSPGPDPYGIGDEPPVAAVKRTIIPAARPAPSAVARPAAVVAPPDADLPSDPHAIPASAVAFYARKSRYAAEAENAEPEEGSNLKNVYVLLALGLGLRVSQLVYANANGANKWAATGDAVAQPGRAVLLALCELVISTTIMVCGATAAAMLLDINFGPIAKAGLKLAATAVFATGVAGWVAVFDRDRHSITGMVVALHIVVIIYWIALAFFFSLELQETMLTVAIISLIQAAGMCVLWKA